VLEGLKPFAGKGRVLQTSLDKDKEEDLRKLFEGAWSPAKPPRNHSGRSAGPRESSGSGPKKPLAIPGHQPNKL